jgi:hypothetical protein
MTNRFGNERDVRAPAKNKSTSGGLLARLLRYIHRHVSRYAPLDVPFRRTQTRRNPVALFITVALRGMTYGFPKIMLTREPNTPQVCDVRVERHRCTAAALPYHCTDVGIFLRLRPILQ